MKRLFDMMEKGILTTRLVTAALTATVIYVEISGGTLSETLRTAWLIIMGFWFNSEIVKNGSKPPNDTGGKS